MREFTGLCFLAVACSLAPQALFAGENTAPSASAPLPDAAQLVREVVYNEMHDHKTHGFWRYWIEHHSNKETHLDEQVETLQGPITRTQMSNGHPLTGEALVNESSRLQHLLNSPSEQAQHRKEYEEDERRIGRIMGLLADAFLYEPTQIQVLPEEACYHLRFHPNPNYPAHSIEGRIFHAMAGDLWISMRNKHLVRLDGTLLENVDFGFGILGRLYRDGWFRLERAKVGSDWKTQRLEVHMIGRAMLFKTISRETSEVRGGFSQVPSGLSLEQAALLISQPANVAATLPAAFVTENH